jgi:uncharacterized protein YebE (UPF0316 family)
MLCIIFSLVEVGMILDLSGDALLLAGLLFGLRILNTAIGTVRLVIVTRQQRLLAAFLAFFEALLFAITIGSVAADLNNVMNLIAYCAGFSVGNYVGMVIERRFITSFMTVNVICSARGYEVATALRERGYGVTVTTGEGKDGTVTMLRSVINNREVPKMVAIIRSTHADAFVAVEEARAVHRGWIRAARSSSP